MNNLQEINEEIKKLKDQEFEHYQQINMNNIDMSHVISTINSYNCSKNLTSENIIVNNQKSIAKEKKICKTEIGTKLRKFLMDNKTNYKNLNRNMFEKISFLVMLDNLEKAPVVIKRPLTAHDINSIKYDINTKSDFFKKLEKSIYKIKNGITNKKTILTKIANIDKTNMKTQTGLAKPVISISNKNDSDDDIFKDIKKKEKQPESQKFKLISEEEKEDVMKYKDIDIFTLLSQEKKK